MKKKINKVELIHDFSDESLVDHINQFIENRDIVNVSYSLLQEGENRLYSALICYKIDGSDEEQIKDLENR